MANKQKINRFTFKGLICRLHCVRQQEKGDKQDNSFHDEDKLCSSPPIALGLMHFSNAHNYKSTKFNSINAEKIVSFVSPLSLTASEEKRCNNKVLHLTYLRRFPVHAQNVILFLKNGKIRLFSIDVRGNSKTYSRLA